MVGDDGNMMVELWENDGKMMGTSWENDGKRIGTYEYENTWNKI